MFACDFMVLLVGKDIKENTNQGIGVYGWNLYLGLKKIKYYVSLFSLDSKKSALNNIYLDQFKLSKLFFRKEKLLHFLAPEYGSLINLTNKKTIVTIHDMIPYIIPERTKAFNLYYKYCCNLAKHADHIITVSEASKKDIIKYLKINSSKITVIHHGVDHKMFYPLKKTKSKYFTIGYLGGLGKRKNVLLLIKAFAKLIKDNKYSNVKLKIGGSGPQKQELEILINKLDIKNNVELEGFIPDNKKNEFYNSLDLFVFPSLYEGFGLPVLEAMSCKVPVLTSNVSSMPELLDGTGYLFENNNLESLINKLQLIINNKRDLNNIANNGYLRSLNFTWEKSIKEHKKIYEKVIK
jgi:glycosyltransferase involved in cell wall biosynthesis